MPIKAAPNAIAPSLYFEVKGSNQYLLVSEWIDGPTLADLLTDQDLATDWRQVRGHLRALFLAIRDTGIRHNDLRNTNIIVGKSSARIVDFGWAYWREESGDDALPHRDDEEAMEDLLLAVEGQIASNGRKPV